MIDLGAAPGGWSQVVAKCVGLKGSVIAIDCLEMAPIPNVTFLQGDFTETNTLEKLDEILLSLNNKPIDWVISDMAPSLSGVDSVDQPRMIYLAELALELALSKLKPGGGFLVKIFQGVGFSEYLQQLRKCFKQVVTRKPPSSRPASREVYLLAREKR